MAVSDHDGDGERTSLRRSLATCALYGTTSVSITFFNKAVFAYYKFDFPCLLTTLQITLCLLFLFTASNLSMYVVSKHAFVFKIKLPRLTLKTVSRILPLTICWWTYVITGIVALKSLNVPLFSTLRKFTALLVLLLETVILHRSSPLRVWFSVAVMVAGGILAGAYEAHMNLFGYFCVTICCVATACYLVMIVHVSASTGLDSWGLLLYNNTLSGPIMLVTTLLVTNEYHDVRHYPYLGSARFWMFLVFSAAQATVLNVAIFLCTNVNSPLATTVTGQIKDILTVVFGMFAFGGFEIRFANVTGLAIALFGSFLYSLAKYRSITEGRRMDRVETTSNYLRRRDSHGSV